MWNKINRILYLLLCMALFLSLVPSARAAGDATVTVSIPSGCELTVTDGAGSVIAPELQGQGTARFRLKDGADYTCIVSRQGTYFAKTGFKASAGLAIATPEPICENWFTRLQAAQRSTAASLASHPYTVEPAFTAERHSYDVFVSDVESSFSAFVSVSRPEITVRALYTRSNSTQENRALTLNQTSGTSLPGLVDMMHGESRVLTLRASLEQGNVTYYQDYCLTVRRILHLYALEVCLGDTPLTPDREFDRDVTAYTVTVPSEAPSVTLKSAITGTGEGYTLTAKTDSNRVSMELTQETRGLVLPLDKEAASETVSLVVSHGDPLAVPAEYTLTIQKTAPAAVKIVPEPADASVVVRDAADGTAQWPGEDGCYSLLCGRNYSVTVSQVGYVASRTDLTPEGDMTLPISLAKAPENPNIDPGITGFWPDYRGGEGNNAITQAKLPDTAEDTALYWAASFGEAQTADSVGCPILADGYLYTYAGNRIYKINPADGSIVCSGAMAGKSQFTYNAPTYAEGMIFVGLDGGKVQAFNARTLESLWLYTDPLGGQPGNSITCRNGYLYTGFWNGETAAANFVCLTVTDEDPDSPMEDKLSVWTYTWKGGYYWSGPCVFPNCVIVGTDDGAEGYTSGHASVLSLDPKCGRLLDRAELPTTGDIRCAMVYDDKTDACYFTTKGGSFYRVKVDASGRFPENALSSIALSNGGKDAAAPAMSTSTPVIFNARAYIGVCGTGQFTAYSGHNITVIDLEAWKVAYTVPTQGYCQAGGILSYGAADGKVNVYFLDNILPGKLRILEDRPGQTAPSRTTTERYRLDGREVSIETAYVLFTPYGPQAQYAVYSPICDADGFLYFKNDSGYLMCVGPAMEKLTVTGQPRTVYRPGEVFDGTGLRVSASYLNGTVRDVTDYVSYSAEPLTADDTELVIRFEHTMYQDRNGVPGTPYYAPAAVVGLTVVPMADIPAADAVESLIAQIPQPVSLEAKEAIEAARAAYNSLSDVQKQLVRNYGILTAAEETLGELMHEHSFTPWTPNGDGTHSRSCSCGTETEACSPEERVIHAPSCEVPGKAISVCTVCDWKAGERVLPETGHFWGEWITEFEPDCTSEGLASHVCLICEKKESVSLAPTGHSFEPWITLTEGHCPEGDGIDVRDCAVCGFREQRVHYAENHFWGDWVTQRQSTCAEPGEKVRICQVCNTAQQEVLPLADHRPVEDAGYAATCAMAGLTDGSHCDVCGTILTEQETIPALPHTPVTDRGVPATCHSDGLTDGLHCAVCGYVIKSQLIEPAFPCPSEGLSDVSYKAWYHDAVDYMIIRGIMAGIGGGLFDPKGNLTRAQLVQVFYNLSGEEWTSTETAFSDVSQRAWYAKPVSWASARGIVSGLSEHVFGPHEAASREMVITILFRYSGDEPVAGDYTAGFADRSKIHSWAIPAMNWAVAKGYVQGSDGKLTPRDSITRAQLAQLMTNYLSLQ